MAALAVIALLKIFVVIMGVFLTFAAFLTWADRKWSALAMDRIGPNRATLTLAGRDIRLNGLVHILADVLKMFFKEDFRPAQSNGFLHALAPLIAFFATLAIAVVIPFTGTLNLGAYRDVPLLGLVDLRDFSLHIAQINVGLVYVLAIASLAPYAATIGGWSTNNRFGLLGALRAASQMISYEVAMGLSLVGLIMIYGTIQLDGMVEAQAGTLWGFLPHWGIFLQPVAAIIFLAAAVAENKRIPFDLPEGESELVAGYFIEYSGMRWGMFFVGEYAEVAVVAALYAVFFLGGYHFPYMTSALYATMATPLIMLLCVFFLTAVFLGVAGARMRGWLPWAVALAAGLGALALGMALNGNLHALVKGLNLGSGRLVNIALWETATAYAPFSQGPAIAKGLAQFLTMISKMLILCWFMVLTRFTYVRFRYDQIMKLGWKMLLPLALANVLITGVIILLAQ